VTGKAGATPLPLRGRLSPYCEDTMIGLRKWLKAAYLSLISLTSALNLVAVRARHEPQPFPGYIIHETMRSARKSR
jgi:hypothetical protein